MSKLPPMPLWVVDYEKDTLDLTPEEDGIYSRFIRQLWIGRGQMPDDDSEIARRLRVDTRVWKRVRCKLGGRVITVGRSPLSYVCNSRVSKEWNLAMDHALAQSDKGKKSAAIRRARALEYQELKRNHGSTTVHNRSSQEKSTAVPTAVSTQLPTPLSKKDISTSSKDAAREATADPPEESEPSAAATAPLNGAPPQAEEQREPETLSPEARRLMNTRLMQGQTPFLPKQRKVRF